MLFLKTGKIFRQGDAAGQNPFNNGFPLRQVPVFF